MVKGLRCAILVPLLVLATSVHARSPRAHELTGTIESVDDEGKLRIRTRTGIIIVAVERDAVKCNHHGSAPRVSVGSAVKVWYRQPFIGSKRATKLVIDCRGDHSQI